MIEVQWLTKAHYRPIMRLINSSPATVKNFRRFVESIGLKPETSEEVDYCEVATLMGNKTRVLGLIARDSEIENSFGVLFYFADRRHIDIKTMFSVNSPEIRYELLNHLVKRVKAGELSSLRVRVLETNAVMIDLLVSLGFRATAMKRDVGPDDDGTVRDGYRFEFWSKIIVYDAAKDEARIV